MAYCDNCGCDSCITIRITRRKRGISTNIEEKIILIENHYDFSQPTVKWLKASEIAEEMGESKETAKRKAKSYASYLRRIKGIRTRMIDGCCVYSIPAKRN